MNFIALTPDTALPRASYPMATARRIARMFGGSFVIWTAFSLLPMYQIYQNRMAMGTPFTWDGVVLEPLLRFWIISVLSVPIYFLTKRFPLIPRALPLSLPVHVLGFVAMTALAMVVRW